MDLEKLYHCSPRFCKRKVVCRSREEEKGGKLTLAKQDIYEVNRRKIDDDLNKYDGGTSPVLLSYSASYGGRLGTHVELTSLVGVSQRPTLRPKLARWSYMGSRPRCAVRLHGI